MQKSLVKHQFSFTGSAAEYFRVWIVNIALTVVTLGIYGPWAKVRREKYFLNHTHLAGATFDYTAKPAIILKARLFVLGILLLILLLDYYSSLITWLAILCIFVFSPWLITKAIKFRARTRSYRNISFTFSGNTTGTFVYFVLWRILGIITLGILYPFARYQDRRYLISNLSYGTSRMKFNGRPIEFYQIFIVWGFLALLPLFITIGIFILRSLVAAFFYVPAELVGEEGAGFDVLITTITGSVGAILMIAFGVAAIVLSPIMFKSISGILARAAWRDARIGPFRCEYNISLLNYFWIYAGNLILIVVSLGLATPYCAVRLHRYKTHALSLYGPKDSEPFMAQCKEEISAFGDESAELLDLEF